MVGIIRCDDEMEASLVRVRLGGAGIATELSCLYDIETYPGGIVVAVAEADAVAARRLLGIEPAVDVCPQCGAREVTVKLLHEPGLLEVVLDRIGLLPLRVRCHCEACRHRWIVQHRPAKSD